MPILEVTVLAPPEAFAPWEQIRLIGDGGSEMIEPESVGKDLVFRISYEVKPNRSGVRLPSGDAIQRGKGEERFVYLVWSGLKSGRWEMFRRVKLYFDRMPWFDIDAERNTVTIQGADKKGEPVCASVKLFPSEE